MAERMLPRPWDFRSSRGIEVANAGRIGIPSSTNIHLFPWKIILAEGLTNRLCGYGGMRAQNIQHQRIQYCMAKVVPVVGRERVASIQIMNQPVQNKTTATSSVEVRGGKMEGKIAFRPNG